MKVVVTGASGQLGQDVVRELAGIPCEVYPLTRAELELTNEDAVRAYMTTVQPDIIIHCAAYTNVDQAETDQKAAYQSNVVATKYLAREATQCGAKIVYISTDYVFNGSANIPYEPEEPTNPLGIYGKTKRLGELFITLYAERYFIVRTSWVFGSSGNNFVKTMMSLGKGRCEVGVVYDQVGAPTYTVDLARFLVELMLSDKYGMYHATNSGICSWYELANEIFRQAGMDVKVNPLTSEEFPRPAERPKYSVLSTSKIAEQGFSPLRDWKEALTAYLQEMQ